MKRFLFLLIFIPVYCFGQYTAIPDQNFEQALIDLGYDNVIDGQVFTSSISSITNLDVSDNSILNLTGIEDFIALKKLDCNYNQLTSLNVSCCTALTKLKCNDNK
jgi:Leucine-rich repeat (LRR) protein